jgi:hypothetical protein
VIFICVIIFSTSCCTWGRCWFVGAAHQESHPLGFRKQAELLFHLNIIRCYENMLYV